jgi:hypothetical protein
VYARPNTTGETQGFFCTKCGSRLVHVHVTVSKDDNGAETRKTSANLSVKSGCLDGLSKDDMRKAVHIWTKSAVVDVSADAKQYPEEPEGGSFDD